MTTSALVSFVVMIGIISYEYLNPSLSQSAHDVTKAVFGLAFLIFATTIVQIVITLLILGILGWKFKR